MCRQGANKFFLRRRKQIYEFLPLAKWAAQSLDSLTQLRGALARLEKGIYRCAPIGVYASEGILNFRTAKKPSG